MTDHWELHPRSRVHTLPRFGQREYKVFPLLRACCWPSGSTLCSLAWAELDVAGGVLGILMAVNSLYVPVHDLMDKLCCSPGLFACGSALDRSITQSPCGYVERKFYSHLPVAPCTPCCFAV